MANMTNTTRNIPSELPEVEFVDTDTEALVNKLIAGYEEITGRTLYPADPVRAFILWLASVIIQERVNINESAKQNLPRYATGQNLDSLSEIFHNTYRLQPTAARTTLGFSITTALDKEYVITDEIEVTVDGYINFVTTGYLTFPAGETYAEVEAVCTTLGEDGNGFTPGQVSRLVTEEFLYFKEVANTTETAGGKYSDVITGGTDETLPFWIMDGEEKSVIYVSKFLNIVENDRAYSLGGYLPRNYINFDQSVAACKKKGAGWHLNQTGVFAYLNLLSQKMGTVPHGNTNYGKDYYHPYERGTMPQGETQRTLTGSGQPTWYHNHDMSGIADINGNLWEWTGGLRLMDGEIQIIPYGNSMKLDCDMSAESTLWKAIKPDGTLVEPGTAGTLKLDQASASAGIRVNTKVEFPTSGDTYRNIAFKSLGAASGVTIPKLLIALGLYPDSGVTGYGNDQIWMRCHGERLPIRGSAFGNTSFSGPSALGLNDPRSGSYDGIGFRSAFVE